MDDTTTDWIDPGGVPGRSPMHIRRNVSGEGDWMAVDLLPYNPSWNTSANRLQIWVPIFRVNVGHDGGVDSVDPYSGAPACDGDV